MVMFSMCGMPPVCKCKNLVATAGCPQMKEMMLFDRFMQTSLRMNVHLVDPLTAPVNEDDS
jgi:hypothetical protein